ncbi:DUF2634 domain-containing protein [Clostridium sp. OF09-36]|uniref:DUF2634 domain-containing protein n=1 Tax=Clostridium sp. OF09-36 TaxID=2292310 RepID=UPI000E4A06A3|nr:DUF2634 domain-containing protein [Clostridium sp. OF09-36]RHV84249.1 DUF2634 domain-containing protein [Clostridium sp. OF09-36]
MELTTDMRIEQQSFSNRSYNVSQTAINGFVTDLEALSQAIHKRLTTQQFEYPIYSFGYGVDWRDLLGQDPEYVRPEMKRMIQETLLEDNRITEVDNFSFEFSGNVCQCTFDVTSIFGITREGVEANV